MHTSIDSGIAFNNNILSWLYQDEIITLKILLDLLFGDNTHLYMPHNIFNNNLVII